VLVLRYWEDLSVARTAELLGIRENACRARSARALARLRALLPDLIDPDIEDPP
jgi:DNA-directed RNA polymerase specialized sigma24 family protein